MDAKTLRNLLKYSPDTGLFTWLVSPTNCVQVGDIAGCVHHGYIEIKINGRVFHAHRLAFLYMEGRWPLKFMDHINMDRSDNRWCNLREATPAQNRANCYAFQNKAVPVKGIYWRPCGSNWEASFRGKYLGKFSTKELAHAAYCKAASEHFGEYARG